MWCGFLPDLKPTRTTGSPPLTRIVKIKMFQSDKMYLRSTSI